MTDHWCCEGTAPCYQCGADDAQNCDACNRAVCDACIASQCTVSSPSEDFEDSPRSPSTEEQVVADTGSVGDSDLTLYAGTNVHAWLRLHWESQNMCVPFHRDMWVMIEPVQEFENSRIDDGIASHQFGRSAGDFKRLAEKLAGHISPGLVLFHLDREKTLVFVLGRKVTMAGAGSALSWLRTFGAMGILMRSRADILEFAIVDVLWHRRQQYRAAYHRARMVSIVEGFTHCA